jgi:hypothetical protein
VRTFEEAKAMASEALLLWLESALEYDEAIPTPKEYSGKEYVAIEVPACMAVAVQLRIERGKRSIDEMSSIIHNYENFKKGDPPSEAHTASAICLFFTQSLLRKWEW